MILQGPSVEIEKPFLWTEGRIILKASLDKHYYSHGENVNVTVEINNESKKTIRKIKVTYISNIFRRKIKFICY